MDEEKGFQMTYSAQVQQEIKFIRSKYVPQQEDKMEKLRALDASATQKATAVGLTVGIVSVLLFGFGMSVLMSEFGALFGAWTYPVGLLSGLIGLAGLVCVYPIYRNVAKKERERIAPQILKLTDELLQ